MESTFIALAISSFIYAIGSGLEEVIISPIVEALPGEQKESAMSILHSFYCWGHVGMVILSTAYLVLLPQKWFILPILWAIVPICSLFLFCFVPIRMLGEGQEQRSMPILALFKKGIFWLFIILMICGAAAEQIMAQWSSLFAESELGVSKLVGNLLGPCFFALMMAITRTFYGKKADKLPLAKTLVICSIISVIGYLTVSLSPYPYLALFGCGLVGIGVAMFWPGVLSIASKALPTGGAPMFAILAMFGDIGCSVGPQASAFVSEIFGGKLKAGLLFSTVFSVIVGVSLTVYLLRAQAKMNAEAKIDE